MFKIIITIDWQLFCDALNDITDVGSSTDYKNYYLVNDIRDSQKRTHLSSVTLSFVILIHRWMWQLYIKPLMLKIVYVYKFHSDRNVLRVLISILGDQKPGFKFKTSKRIPKPLILYVLIEI